MQSKSFRKAEVGSADLPQTYESGVQGKQNQYNEEIFKGKKTVFQIVRNHSVLPNIHLIIHFVSLSLINIRVSQ